MPAWLGKWLFTAIMDYLVSFFSKLIASKQKQDAIEQADAEKNKKLDEAKTKEEKARAAEDVWNG